MSDLIDRQAAIDTITAYPHGDVWNVENMENMVYEIKNLPPAQPEQRWIPVTERLPEKHGESYIVTISDGAVYSAALQWDANCKRFYLSFLKDDGYILVDYIEDVIAWMSLPEPYQRGDE